MSDRATAALEAMSDAVLAIAAEHSVERCCSGSCTPRGTSPARATPRSACPTARATSRSSSPSGMTDELIAAMGPLPRTHGLLGAMLESPAAVPHRRHPARPALPRLVAERAPADGARSSASRSSRAAASSAPSTSPTRRARRRSATTTSELIEMLAAHAAIAIENARLLRAQPRAERRSRSATGSPATCTTPSCRSCSGIVLTAQSAATLLERSTRRGARARSSALAGLAQEAIGELRSLVFQLRPAAIEAEGLAAALRQARRRARGACTACRSTLEHQRRAAACGPASTRSCSGSPRRRCTTRCATPPPRTCGSASTSARRPSRCRSRDDGRGFDPGRARAALAQPRPDVDGGAGAGARRRAAHRLGARRGHDDRPGGAAGDPRPHR